MATPPAFVVPTVAMTKDLSSYQNLLTALKYNCMDDAAIKKNNADCSTAGSGWLPPMFSTDPARATNGVEPTDAGYGIPVWQMPVGQWDAGVNYRFSDHFSGSFNISNLTRTVTKQVNQQTPGDMGRSWFDPGRSFRMQATYVF
jgi:hypothetical protein